MATPTIRQEIAGTSTTVTSLTNTATFSSAALAGNQLVYLIAGDKNTGTLSVTDNTGSGTWTVEVSLPSTSVSLYVARKVAVGGETTITGTTTAAPATGNTGYALELDQAGTGAWGVVAKATNITTEATVSSMSTGTTGAATFEGLAIAAMAVDSATNVTSGSWSNGYTARYDAPTTSGTGGGAGGIHVASAGVAQGATTTSTWTNTTGTADQQSAAVVVFGRAASVSVVGTGASALALSTTTAGQKAATSTGSSVLGLATTRSGSSTRTSTAGSTLGVATTSVASSSRSGTGLSALGITTTGQGVKDTVSLPAGGPLFFNFYVVEADGTYSAALPDYRSASIEPVFGEDGSVTIDYPVDGLNYELLRDGVTDELDLELAVWVGGRSDKSMRVLLTESDADLVAETGIHRFGGAFLNVLMSDMVVLPNPANEKQETVFTSATAGAIMTTLIATAKAAGYLASIGTSTFNGSHDSNGVAWSNVVNTKFSPGRGYHDVLGDLVKFGLCEWEVGPDRELRLYQFGTLGTDRTVGSSPIILRWGRHLVSAPRKTSVRTAGTDVLAAGKEGLYQTASSASARARRGRRILRYVTANGIEDAGSLTAYAQAQLQVVTAGQLEQSHGLSFGKDDPLPIADYGIGDWIGSDTGAPDVAFVKRRVRQWRFAEDENGEITGSVVVGTLLQDTQAALAARIAAIEGGATVVGTSTATPADDTMPPAAPTGLVVGSNIAYQVPEHTQTLAELIIGWGEVTTNADGTPAEDVDSYRVQYTYLGAAQVGTILDPGPGYDPGPLHWIEPSGSPVRDLVLRFGEVEAGVAVAVRVAAIDRSGNQSAWSSSLEITTASDDTPAPVPAAPTLSVWFRTIDITSNGLGSAGEAMPSDWDHNEVWLSQAASPTLPATASEPAAFNPATTGAQHVANLYGAGTWNQPDIPIGIGWYAVLRSVDRTGNVSAPSAVAGPVTAEKLVQIDIGPDAIGRQQVIDGEIVRAKIGDAAINSAKVEELQAGLITTGTMTATVTNSGIIQTASTGSRLRFDSSGLQLYNAANTLVGQWKTSDASMLMTGTFRTALSGERLEGNPDGTLRLYPAAGTNYNAIYNEGGGGLIFRSGFDGANRAGFLYLRSNSAQISYGTPGTLIANSRLQCSINASELWGGQIVYRADRNFGTINRHTFTQFSGNADIFNTVLYLQDTGGTGQFPWFHSIGGNSGFIFGPNYMATANSAANLIELRASNVASPSSRRLKQQEKAIGWTRPGRVEQVTALDVVRGAKAKEWEYLHEAKGTRPPRPGKNQQRLTDEQGRPLRDADGQEMFEEVDVEWSWEERPAPKHYGPMAEDLEALAPDLVRRDAEDPSMVFTDVRDLLGVLWKAVDELADQLDTRAGPRTIRP